MSGRLRIKSSCVILSNMESMYSLYLHIPFCQKRCHYCDFNSYADMEQMLPAYVDALCREIDECGKVVPVHTIYLGGGTPSLLSPDQIRKILKTIRRQFALTTDVEISLEANPGTVNLEKLEKMRQAGVNRLSLGIQSANMSELAFLGRIHGVVEIRQAMEWARSAGFDNINLDLMFGLPGQKMKPWQNSIEFALNLEPDHISFYGLTIEDDTLLGYWVKKGLVEIPDPDLGADMYEWAGQRLEQAGFAAYEISNWARIDHQRGWLMCRHNLQYWRSLPWLGFGAGAHGFTKGLRLVNASRIEDYINRIRNGSPLSFPLSPANVEVIKLNKWDEAQEMMMMGLRLTHEGVSADDFNDRFGISLEDAFGCQISGLMRYGLLEWVNIDGLRLRLTRKGWLLGNQVFMEFVGCPLPLLFDNDQGAISIG